MRLWKRKFRGQGQAGRCAPVRRRRKKVALKGRKSPNGRKSNCWGVGRDKETPPTPSFHIRKSKGALTSVFSGVWWRSWGIMSEASLRP